MEELPESNTANNTQTTTEANPATVGWAIAAVALAIIMLVFNDSPLVLRAGFFAKVFAFLLGAFGGWLGAMMGNGIRQFAMPDGMLTSGGMGSIIKFKLFWMVGPQLIGLVLGTALGISIVLN